MGSYALARVSGSIEGVYLWSTDGATLDWITSELNRYIPSYTVKEVYNLPSGRTYEYWIANLQCRHDDVVALIIKLLCLRGWEPFAIESGTVYLKLK